MEGIAAVDAFADHHTVITGRDEPVLGVTDLHQSVRVVELDPFPVHFYRVLICLAVANLFSHFGWVLVGVDGFNASAKGDRIGVHALQEVAGLLIVSLWGHEPRNEFTLRSADGFRSGRRIRSSTRNRDWVVVQLTLRYPRDEQCTGNHDDQDDQD